MDTSLHLCQGEEGTTPLQHMNIIGRTASNDDLGSYQEPFSNIVVDPADFHSKSTQHLSHHFSNATPSPLSRYASACDWQPASPHPYGDASDILRSDVDGDMGCVPAIAPLHLPKHLNNKVFAGSKYDLTSSENLCDDMNHSSGGDSPRDAMPRAQYLTSLCTLYTTSPTKSDKRHSPSQCTSDTSAPCTHFGDVARHDAAQQCDVAAVKDFESSQHTCVAEKPLQRPHHTIQNVPPPAECFYVLSDDKLTLTMIPSDLIEPTLGSLRYVQQGPSASFTFRFQLCRAFGQEGRCAHLKSCSFIHSRHVLDPSLRSLVKETAVHINIPLNGSIERAPYRRLPPGLAIQVYDHVHRTSVVVHSMYLYDTHGAREVYAIGAQSKASSKLCIHPTMKLQFCLHFDRGMCARGEECHFVHRVLVDTPPPNATVIPGPPVPPVVHAVVRALPAISQSVVDARRRSQTDSHRVPPFAAEVTALPTNTHASSYPAPPPPPLALLPRTDVANLIPPVVVLPTFF